MKVSRKPSPTTDRSHGSWVSFCHCEINLGSLAPTGQFPRFITTGESPPSSTMGGKEGVPSNPLLRAPWGLGGRVGFTGDLGRSRGLGSGVGTFLRRPPALALRWLLGARLWL